MKDMPRRISGTQLLVREADLRAAKLNEFSWLGPMKHGCNRGSQHENCTHTANSSPTLELTSLGHLPVTMSVAPVL